MSVLMYDSVAWYTPTLTVQKKLMTFHRSFWRLATGAVRNENFRWIYTIPETVKDPIEVAEMADLTFFYKCYFRIYDCIPIDNFIQFTESRHGRITRHRIRKINLGHLEEIPSKTKVHQHSFFKRAIHLWNLIEPEDKQKGLAHFKEAAEKLVRRRKFERPYHLQ